MNISQKQVKYLRKLGHGLSPIVTVADRGLIDTVMLAIEEGLDKHELIKVKVRHDRDQRNEICKTICKKTGAEMIQQIGMVLLIYRPNKKPTIDFSGHNSRS